MYEGCFQLITKLKSNMKGALMTMSDRLLTRKRAISPRNHALHVKGFILF